MRSLSPALRRAAALAALLLPTAGCGRSADDSQPEPVNAPLTVGSVTLPAERVRGYLAREVGFTSHGGSLQCSYAVLGQEADRVFLWTACEELIAAGDSLEVGSGTGLPVVLRVDTASQPHLAGLLRPGDGNRYARDIARLFPAGVVERIHDRELAERRGRMLGEQNRRAFEADSARRTAEATPPREG